jgi:hypothetical protein
MVFFIISMLATRLRVLLISSQKNQALWKPEKNLNSASCSYDCIQLNAIEIKPPNINMAENSILGPNLSTNRPHCQDHELLSGNGTQRRWSCVLYDWSSHEMGILFYSKMYVLWFNWHSMPGRFYHWQYSRWFLYTLRCYWDNSPQL